MKTQENLRACDRDGTKRRQQEDAISTLPQSKQYALSGQSRSYSVFIDLTRKLR